MTDIAHLKAEVQRLRADLKQAEEALFAANQEASSVKIGDIYWRKAARGYGRNAKEFEERARVIGFETNQSGDAIPRLRILKQDGSDSMRIRQMLSFEYWQRAEP